MVNANKLIFSEKHIIILSTCNIITKYKIQKSSSLQSPSAIKSEGRVKGVLVHDMNVVSVA
jgi:hypothetical protein